MDFGGGEAVGPPGRARRSHFSLSGELALSGRTGAARAGAAGRTARPVAASTNHLTEADESSLHWPRGPSARALARSSWVRPVQREADQVPSKHDAVPLGGPLLRREGSPRVRAQGTRRRSRRYRQDAAWLAYRPGVNP